MTWSSYKKQPLSTDSLPLNDLGTKQDDMPTSYGSILLVRDTTNIPYPLVCVSHLKSIGAKMFKQRLKALVYRSLYGSFHLLDVETLSNEIHTAEMSGYQLSPSEDRLWIKLTERIQQEYKYE